MIQRTSRSILAACVLTVLASSGIAGDARRPEWSLLVFRSHTCPPCDVLERETLANEAVRRELAGVRVSIIQIEDEPELSLRFIVTATPHMVFLRDGTAEDYLMGALPPDKFIEQWHRISAGGNSTVSGWIEQVALRKEECLMRGQLGIKQALLGDDVAAALQLDRMVVVTDVDKKARADLQVTIHNARYMRIRERISLARSHGEVPSAFELRELVREKDMVTATRYPSLRLLIGVLEEHVEREADPTRRDSALSELARVKMAAWVDAPRPLSDDDRRHAVEGVRGLLREGTEPTESDRERAAKIVEEFVALRPDASDTREIAAVVLWLAGRRDEAIAKAKSISDPMVRDDLLAEFDMRSVDRTPPK